MKARFLREVHFLSLFLSFAIVAVLASPNAQARPLALASFLPPSSPASIEVKSFIDNVQAKEPKIKFQFYPSGAIATGKTTLSAIKGGLIDGGFIVAVYTPSALPVNMLFSDLSFYDKDPRVMAAAITDTVLNDCPSCRKEWRSHNVHFLAAFATPPYHAMCKDKMSNGFNPKGLRMRAPGEELGNWIKKIGGIPVEMPNSEAYQAMERGELDCVVGAQLWLKTLSLVEVTRSVLSLPMGGYVGGSGVNIAQSDWVTLDKHTQSVMKRAALKAMAASEYDFVNNQKAVIANARKQGVNFLNASRSLQQQRKAYMESEVGRAIAKSRKRGAHNPAQIVHTYQKNLAKWHSLIVGKQLSEGQYAQLLITQILNKP